MSKMKGMGEDYSRLPKERGEQLKRSKVYPCTDPSTSLESLAVQKPGGKFSSLSALPDHHHGTAELNVFSRSSSCPLGERLGCLSLNFLGRS